MISVLPGALAVNSTVGTSTNNGAVNGVPQRKTCFQTGLYWLFYFDGSNIVWRTSPDGSSWSAAAIASGGLRAGVDGTSWSIYCDGTYIHAAYALGFLQLYYRRGLTNAAGSMTWSAEQVAATQSANSQAYPTITVDGSGHAWIGAQLYLSGVTKHNPYVLKNSRADGTWSTASGFPFKLSSVNDANWRVVIVHLSGSAMGVYYVENANHPILFRSYTGTAWKSELTVPGGNASSSGFLSAVGDSNSNSQIVFTNTSHTIIHATYMYSTNTFGSKKTVQASVTSTTAAVLTIDPSTNNLYASWAGSPTAGFVYYKKYAALTRTWDATPTALVNTGPMINNSITSSYAVVNGVVGVEYETSLSAPFNVDFATIP